MPFASFETHVNKGFAIVFACFQVISNCDVILLWITWQNNHLRTSRHTVLSRELLSTNSVIQSVKKGVTKEIYQYLYAYLCVPLTFGMNKNLKSPDMVCMPWMYTPWTTNIQIKMLYPICKLSSVVSTAFYTTGKIHWFSHPNVG